MLHNLVWVLTGINLIIKAPNVLVVESLICEVQSPKGNVQVLISLLLVLIMLEVVPSKTINCYYICQ